MVICNTKQKQSPIDKLILKPGAVNLRSKDDIKELCELQKLLRKYGPIAFFMFSERFRIPQW